jgi:hypothetical protein
MRRTLSVVLLLSCIAPAAPLTSSQVSVLSGAQDFTFSGLNSNQQIFLVSERTQYVLPSDVLLDTLPTGGGGSVPWPGSTVVLGAGTVVDVWLLYARRSSFVPALLTGSIDFGVPILGYSGRTICGLGGSCPADTRQHGNPASVYPSLPIGAGLELGLLGDRIQQTSNGSVSVSMLTNRILLDQVRIFTDGTTPEPSSYLLIAAGLLALLAARRGASSRVIPDPKVPRSPA